MSKVKGKVYSAEQKTKIVLETLKEDQTIGQIASKYEVTTKTIQNWKNQFLDNAVIAFEPSNLVKEYKDTIKAKEEEIDELHKQLGKATIKVEFLEKKLESLDLCNKKALIESEHKELTIKEQCEILKVCRSSYYYIPKPISEYDLNILNAIDEIYTDNSDYGYRLIHQVLLEKGFKIGKDRVLKYMRILGINAIYKHKKRATSLKNKEHQVYNYLLKEYWTIDSVNHTKSVYVPHVNEVWSSDITYIRMNGGFMYLCAIIDWHSRAILSYKISNCMDTALVTDVLKDALSKYPKPKIFNTDQGSQYTSAEHTQILKDNNIQISMNGKGRSIDNIIIERFFRTLKHSNIYISDYTTIKELKRGVEDFIYKYNFKRFHSSLNYQKPMNVYLQQIENVA